MQSLGVAASAYAAGDYDKAATVLRDFLAAPSGLADLDVALASSLLGNTLRELNDHNAALAAYTRAAELMKKLYGPGAKEYGNVLGSIAVLHSRRGDGMLSAKFATKEAEIMLAICGEGAEYGRAQLRAGRGFLQSGDTDNALKRLLIAERFVARNSDEARVVQDTLAHLRETAVSQVLAVAPDTTAIGSGGSSSSGRSSPLSSPSGGRGRGLPRARSMSASSGGRGRGTSMSVPSSPGSTSPSSSPCATPTFGARELSAPALTANPEATAPLRIKFRDAFSSYPAGDYSLEAVAAQQPKLVLRPAFNAYGIGNYAEVTRLLTAFLASEAPSPQQRGRSKSVSSSVSQRATPKEKRKENEQLVYMALAYGLLGDCQRDQGDYEAALESYIKAAERMKQHFSDESRNFAMVLGNIAMLHLRRKDFPLALKFSQKEAAILKKLSGEVDVDYGRAVLRSGQAHLELGEVELAVEALLVAQMCAARVRI